MKTVTSGFIRQSGPWIPCLKEGEKVYTLTPEELSELLRKAYADGYQSAKDLYYVPEVTTSISSSWDVAKETEHGTH
jgi:hypothetical protein